jgi:hypothetical protein
MMTIIPIPTTAPVISLELILYPPITRLLLFTNSIAFSSLMLNCERSISSKIVEINLKFRRTMYRKR